MLALQANLPETLPGQNVTFIVYGDAELVNEVPPEEQEAPPPVLSGQTTGGTNVRSGPGTGYAIAGTLSVSEEVTAVGRNEAGDWVQIDFGDSPAWAYAPLLTMEGDVNVLVVVAAGEVVESAYTAPMQAFRFTSGVGEPVCQEAPKDGLLVQAPTDTTVHFMINGVEVEVGSTALLLVDEDLLGVNTFDGVVNVTSGGETQTAEPGYQVIAAASVPPTEPEPYEYENVRTAPVEVLPELVSIPVTVPGDLLDGWLDSGISVHTGQTFTISASGEVNIWTDCETYKIEQDIPDIDCARAIIGPAGGRGIVELIFDDPAVIDAYPARSEIVGILLGRIDEGEMFAVGEGGTFTADRDGTLQFRVNDDNLNDNNEGAFIVIVEIAEEE